MAIECFCIGLEMKIYDYKVFNALAQDYFNDKKGAIRPTLEPMITQKINQNNKNYYPALKRTWDKMDKNNAH